MNNDHMGPQDMADAQAEMHRQAEDDAIAILQAELSALRLSLARTEQQIEAISHAAHVLLGATTFEKRIEKERTALLLALHANKLSPDEGKMVAVPLVPTEDMEEAAAEAYRTAIAADRARFEQDSYKRAGLTYPGSAPCVWIKPVWGAMLRALLGKEGGA